MFIVPSAAREAELQSLLAAESQLRALANEEPREATIVVAATEAERELLEAALARDASMVTSRARPELRIIEVR